MEKFTRPPRDEGSGDADTAACAGGERDASSAMPEDATQTPGHDVPFDPIAYINEPRWRRSHLGLERIRLLMGYLGDPQRNLHVIHVAGTNGKGSVCAYLDAVLRAAGYRCGLFTSPYIETFEERIRVDGRNISHEDLRDVTIEVRDAADQIEREMGEHPTEFELMCAVALMHFARSSCDIVILEVGLGGRLDSTNVIESPLVSVITRIGLDHTDVLGETLGEIAREKAGIVKPGVPVVSWPQEGEADQVIRETCAKAGSPLLVPDFSCLSIGTIHAADLPAAVEGRGDAEPLSAQRTMVRGFTYRDETYVTRLLGAYQPCNAAVALEAVRLLRMFGWNVSEEACRAGIADAVWPGRFEVIAWDPLTLVDGGHNLQGAQALVDSLADMNRALGLPPRSCHFAMGVLADKDYRAMLGTVVPYARSFTLFAPDNPRALPAEELAASLREVCAERGVEDIPVDVAPTPFDALSRARVNAGLADETAVGFGSLYSIADMKHGDPFRS